MTLHVPALSARPRTATARLLAGRALVVGLVAAGTVTVPGTAPASASREAVRSSSLAAAPADADRARLGERASRSGARERLAAPAAAPALPLSGASVTSRVLVTERLPLPFRTVRRADAARYKGTETVVQAGREGVLERTYADLGPGGRRLLQEERVREPVTRVVAVGTKPRPAPRPTYGGLDWAALAQCESGGDPRAVSSTGKYRGLYQFSFSTWRSVGGTGDPAAHSRDSQTSRAWKLYQRDGRAPWPHCGRHL